MPFRVKVKYTSVDAKGKEHHREQTMVVAQQPGETITSLPRLSMDRLPFELIHSDDIENYEPKDLVG